MDGEKRYILAPLGLKVGDTVVSGPEAPIRDRQCAAAAQHPDRYADPQHRAAQGQGRPDGALGRHLGPADGEERATTRRSACHRAKCAACIIDCMATLGQVGNVDHENIEIGKAGRSRYMGRRPTVRGSVMNPRDHPHGGGEGKAPIGGQPKTKWGKPAFQRTRNNKRTDSMIVRRRPANGGGRDRRRPLAGDEAYRRASRRIIMGRSSKKGPYIDAKLQEKIEVLNRAQRPQGHPHLGARIARSSRAWWGTRSPSTTAGSTCRSS